MPEDAARVEGREAWEAERRSGIGGSDVDDALGEAPYGCARRLGYDKLGVAPDYEQGGANLMRRGTDLEPIVCARYTEETGRKLVRRASSADAAAPWKRVNVDREILGVKEVATPTGVLTDPGVGALEVKTHAAALFSKVKREGLPASHILQLQWGCHVRRRKWGSYAVLNPETWDLLVFDVAYDAELIDAIVPRVQAVWEAITRGELAEKLDPKDKRCGRCAWRRTCQGDALVNAYVPSEDRDAHIEWDGSFLELLTDRAEAKRLLDEAEGTLDAIDEAIKARFGDRQSIECEGFRAYYRHQPGRKMVDGEMLKKKHPDVYAEVLKTSKPSRPLRIYSI